MAPVTASPGGGPANEVPADAVPAGELRVGHVDRERVVRRLCAAVGEGRLTLAESADRQALAYAARFPRELAALIDDLPAEVPDAAPADTGRPGGGRLRDALRTVIVINGIALSVGLSTVPGAAALAALLSGITIMIVVVAAEGLGGLQGRKRAPGRPAGAPPPGSAGRRGLTRAGS